MGVILTVNSAAQATNDRPSGIQQPAADDHTANRRIGWQPDHVQSLTDRLGGAMALSGIFGSMATGLWDRVASGMISRVRGPISLAEAQRGLAMAGGAVGGTVGALAGSQSSSLGGSVGLGALAGAAAVGALGLGVALITRSADAGVSAAKFGALSGAIGGAIEHLIHH